MWVQTPVGLGITDGVVLVFRGHCADMELAAVQLQTLNVVERPSGHRYRFRSEKGSLLRQFDGEQHILIRRCSLERGTERTSQSSGSIVSKDGNGLLNAFTSTNPQLGQHCGK